MNLKIIPLQTRWIALAVFIGILFLVKPWGEFPINDDWQYSKIARHFAEYNEYQTPYNIAPALVGQVLLAYPVIKFFGFSHLILRFLTLILSCIMILGLDRWLQKMSAPKTLRTVALLAWVVNPLFLHSAMSYMNEVYGYFPALAAALLWFHSRHKNEKKASLNTPLIDLKIIITTAILAGIAFWTRQFASLVWPALALAYVIRLWTDQDLRPRLSKEIPKLITGAIVFLGIIAAYYIWSSATGNLNKALSSQMNGNLFSFVWQVWVVQAVALPMYLTLFFAGILPLINWKSLHKKTFFISLIVIFPLYGAGIYLLQLIGLSPTTLPYFVSKSFPVLMNIINLNGIGPITMTDKYRWFLDVALPQGQVIWRALYWILAIVTPVVVAASFAMITTRVKGKWKLTNEMALFAALFSIFILVVTIQVYQFNIFDRYYFPFVLSFFMACPVIANCSETYRFSGMRKLASLILLLPVAIYSVAGNHDYFRWQEARWKLFNEALAHGIHQTDLDGGYEINGWFSDDFSNHIEVQTIEKTCYSSGWYCAIKPFLILSVPIVKCSLLKTKKSASWLGLTPKLYLQNCEAR